MADDPITGRLDAIRERRAPLEQPGIGLELMLHGLVSAEDVPRLLAAVDAVLKMTAGSGEPDLDWDGNPEHCMIRVVRCDEIRAAIERELTRKEGSDNG